VHTVHTAEDLRHRVAAWRDEEATVSFVPTMGALHEGHLSLVRRAKALADRTVVSIFVNPTQFGPGEDLESYPRTPEEDARRLAEEGCDLLFLPTPAVIYPEGFATWVEVGGPPAEGLEGEHRPGHFRGVATVVTVLLELVGPDLAVFGEKDAQQLAVVRRVVRDLRLPVEIVAGPTVREEDGLALSSRNLYLDPEERRSATVLHRALVAARDALENGERNADALRRRMREVLDAEPRAETEYAEVVDAVFFRPIEGTITGPVVLPLAVRIGRTRLIDNLHWAPVPNDPTQEAQP
jgi:pantoate--beta-alanine ligase